MERYSTDFMASLISTTSFKEISKFMFIRTETVPKIMYDILVLFSSDGSASAYMTLIFHVH